MDNKSYHPSRVIIVMPEYYYNLNLSLEEVVVLSVLSDLYSRPYPYQEPITENDIIRNLGGRFTIKVNKMLTKLEKKGFIKRGVSDISFGAYIKRIQREYHTNG